MNAGIITESTRQIVIYVVVYVAKALLRTASHLQNPQNRRYPLLVSAPPKKNSPRRARDKVKVKPERPIADVIAV